MTYKDKWVQTYDVCRGDYIRFYKKIFVGKYPNAKYIGEESMEGEVIKESYGLKRGQHTFTIKTEEGNIRMKGRNLYELCYRKEWENEEERKRILDEKHERAYQVKNSIKERIYE